MFDSIAKKYDFGSNTGQWSYGTPRDGVNNDMLNAIGYDASTAGPNIAYGGANEAFDPSNSNSMEAYLQGKGLRIGQMVAPDGFNYQQLFDAQGNPQGQQYRNSQDQDPGGYFGMGMAGMTGFGLAAGLGAAGVMGATAAPSAGATGSGLSADSLAYGALENGAAYGGGYGAPMVASSEAGSGLGALEGGAAGGAAGGGLSSADAAALYGAEGYGAAATPAELAAGGAGGGGLMSQLGGYASDASTWMKNNPMLTNLGGTALNGLIGAYTSNNALNAQRDATNQANALLAPYRETGVAALGKLNGLMQNPSSITQDPGYQFGLSQGVQGVDRSAASKGGLYSGATLKALDRYGQDYGGTKLNDAYSRYGSVAQLGATGTQNMANNTTGLGNAAAGTAFYQGNTLQNGINQTLGNFNYQNALAQNPYNQSAYQQPKP